MNSTKNQAKMPVIAALVVGLAGGVLISNYTILGKQLGFKPAAEKPAEKETLYWVAPMDPNFRRDEPGKSPMGMDLVPVYADDMSAMGDDEDTVHIGATMEHNLGVRTSKVERDDPCGARWRRPDI